MSEGREVGQRQLPSGMLKMTLQKQAGPNHLDIQLSLQIHLKPLSNTQKPTLTQTHTHPIHALLISFPESIIQIKKCTSTHRISKHKVMKCQSGEDRSRKITVRMSNSCIRLKPRGSTLIGCSHTELKHLYSPDQ